MDTDAITCRVNETSLVIRREDDRNEPCTFCLEKNPCEPWVYNLKILKKQLGPVTDQEVEQPGKLLLRSSWDVQTISWKYAWCLFANIPFSKNPVQTSSVNWSWKSTFQMFRCLNSTVQGPHQTQLELLHSQTPGLTQLHHDGCSLGRNFIIDAKGPNGYGYPKFNSHSVTASMQWLANPGHHKRSLKFLNTCCLYVPKKSCRSLSAIGNSVFLWCSVIHTWRAKLAEPSKSSHQQPKDFVFAPRTKLNVLLL